MNKLMKNLYVLGLVLLLALALAVPAFAAEEETGEAARQEDWGEAADRLERAYEDWDSSQTFFHTIMEHDELDKAEDLFAGAFAVCREEDGADFHTLLAQLVNQLRLLAETQNGGIKNVL